MTTVEQRPATQPRSTDKTPLTAGIAAGPVYLVTALAQALTRPGFDPARSDVSLLAIGPGGWIQVANFVVTGLLVIACSVGLKSRLIATFGAGLIAAGIFVADPANTAISWHGALHIVTAGIGFLAFTAACLARKSLYSRVTGIAFLAGFAGVATGSTSPAVVIGFWVAVALAFAWLAVTAVQTKRTINH
ncbi:DUF998 domain-containing protein [Amycolatopsis carbonis]|uniref:DUF998 domain-containing protein n=1 Tax=Amycolatopsis carbonis TaxID=715471 RepID=A0A9Y2IN97_9PSEU|nr:DUF998 domain-containing protein [Amycolatopsis sp. 2-15]WIX82381.1 DUF998 domain-containing protein [Amycolatopsis sp. 2-15]